MLELLIERREGFDESTNQFVTIPEKRIELEHPLRSLSKWEAKHKKPYMSSLEKHRKTEAEVVDYFRCMCLNDVDPKIFDELTHDHIKQIGDYLQDSQTATWFREDAAKKTPPDWLITGTTTVLGEGNVGVYGRGQGGHLRRMAVKHV